MSALVWETEENGTKYEVKVSFKQRFELKLSEYQKNV